MCFSSSLPRASSSPAFFKALAVSCFSRQLQSLPPTNGSQEKGPATSQHDRGLLALTHTHTCALSSSPWGEHKLDITACKKVVFILWHALPVRSYFRWMLSSAAIHNIFLVHSRVAQKTETTSTKKCFSPGELAAVCLKCLLAA